MVYGVIMKTYALKYYTPAQDSMEGWEKYSMPIGNGYFGASVFGLTDSERIQFTTNAFANDYDRGGVSSFADIRLDFGLTEVVDYERGLNLNEGFAYSQYAYNGNRYQTKAFYSYPDRVFVYKVNNTQKTDFSVRLLIPYLNTRTIEEGGRTGKVYAENNTLVMRGELPFRELIYEGRVFVETNGQVSVEGEKLTVKGSTETVIYFVAETSYLLDETIFLAGNHKAIGEDPAGFVREQLKKVVALGYEGLYARHKADYSALMSRVDINIGGQEDARSTEELLESNREGNFEPYLEELYYQFGRHLLVSSSRKGTPPASLQGVWSAYDKSPWGNGFWHNINVQMNYWPAFSANLAETFEAYAAFNKAFRKQAENLASEWIAQNLPESYVEGQGACGWLIGVKSYCYEIEGMCQHSGPGTGALTTQLFWDYYDYTRDEKILREVTYPAIHGASGFLTKCVCARDGEYLAAYSASPEQIIGGMWLTHLGTKQPYYHTVGCAFDQQMFYENAKNDLKCAEILGLSDEITEIEKKQIEAYSPVLIGYSGQIKEYREENYYGEIGEYKHRHISQLVGLSPGLSINYKTPAWLDSAKRTLTFRGDESTGWALAHRLCSWARTGDGDHAYLLLQNLLKTRTYPNLWDVHPPFQIDGNFGAVSGMTEMLLQSYDNCIHLFPALPKAWGRVCFSGLKARGNFTVSATADEGVICEATILSNKGGEVCMIGRGVKSASVTDETGKEVETTITEDGLLLATEEGKTYTIKGFNNVELCAMPTHFNAYWTDEGVELVWKGSEKKYAIYRAVGNESAYQLLGYTKTSLFVDGDYNKDKKVCLSYRVTALTEENEGESEAATAFIGSSLE